MIQTVHRAHDLWNSSDDEPDNYQIETTLAREVTSGDQRCFDLFESSTESEKSTLKKSPDSTDWRLMYLNERKLRKQLEREVSRLQRRLIRLQLDSEQTPTEISGTERDHNFTRRQIGTHSSGGLIADTSLDIPLFQKLDEELEVGNLTRANGGMDAVMTERPDLLPTNNTSEFTREEKQHNGVVAAQQRARRAHAVRSRAAAASGTSIEGKRTRTLRSKLQHVPASNVPNFSGSLLSRGDTAPVTEHGVDNGLEVLDSRSIEEDLCDDLDNSFWDSEVLQTHHSEDKKENSNESSNGVSLSELTSSRGTCDDAEVRIDVKLKSWARGKNIVQLLDTLPETKLLPDEAFQDVHLPMDSVTLPIVRRNYLKIIKHCHPDKLVYLPPSSERTLELQKLFTILSDSYEAMRSQVLSETPSTL